MADVLIIQTLDWELSIWTTHLTTKQNKFSKMLEKRGIGAEPSRLRINASSPISSINAYKQGDLTALPPSVNANNTLTYELQHPLFFENQFYQFEWVFSAAVADAKIAHRLQKVADSFRFANRGHAARLTGTINTRNDIGWLTLPMRYLTDLGWQSAEVSIEVCPVKLAMHSDLANMYPAIEQAYPLWLFSLARQTEQNAGNRRQRGFIPLFWLQMFREVQADIVSGLKSISASPHHRLMAKKQSLKADKIKGKLTTKLTEKICEDRRGGLFDKHYRVHTKHLSVDTPENQFIKYVVQNVSQRLSLLCRRLRSILSRGELAITMDFVQEVEGWQLRMQRFLQQGFFREVTGVKHDVGSSLVLQQRTGYSKVNTAYLQLTFLLDALGDTAKISMKSVAQVYEVWCFLKIKTLLVDELKFTLIEPKGNLRAIKNGFEFAFSESQWRDYHFTRNDGLLLRLQLTPSFSRTAKTSTAIRTYLNTQEPDILLEATFADGKSFVWLFDAKYRLDNQCEDSDLVPKDAINQMHRYRDALIQVSESNDAEEGYTTKHRPVFGAFALYPGYFDQRCNSNPYQEAIDEVGIGAFALMPSKTYKFGDRWLIDFLGNVLGKPATLYPTKHSNSLMLMAQDSARIPYGSMKTVALSNLTLTAELGRQQGREPEYFNRFLLGSAQWYHIPERVFNRKYRQHVVEEVRFLAIVVADASRNTKSIPYLWPVKSVVLKKRSELSLLQSGKIDEANDRYWLFELGHPVVFDNKITNLTYLSFPESLKLTTLENLDAATDFELIHEVYLDGVV